MKTKHKQGYTPQEIERLLLNDKTINEHKFYRKLNRKNCIIVDGDIVVPNANVEYALRFST